jgi:hypothetical protein
MEVLYQNRGPILSLIVQAMGLKLKPKPRQPFALKPQESAEPSV